jgi:hypothetical protein
MTAHRSTRLAQLYFALVMISYAVVILLAKMPPPFVDFPDWVYQGVLFHGVITGHPIAGYALKHYPIPNSLTTVGIGILNTLMPWQWAGKVWVCLYLALAAFATWSLERARGVQDWRLLVAVPGIVFLNLNFWYGHISFEIGVCLVMLLLAMLLRGASGPAVMAMLIAIYFTHMEACAGALLLVAIWYGSRQQWKRLWAVLPTLGLTAWYAIARFGSGNVDGAGLQKADHRYGSAGFLVYKANTLFKTFAYVNARTLSGLSISEKIFGRELFLLLILLSLVLATLCLVSIIKGAASAGRAIRAFVLALLAISLLLPQVWLGVADPGSRLLLLTAAIGLFAVNWKGRAGTPIAVLSALLCLCNLGQFAVVERHPRMQGATRDLPAALLTYGHVEPENRLLYYDKLDRNVMDQTIFPTALFYKLQQ